MSRHGSTRIAHERHRDFLADQVPWIKSLPFLAPGPARSRPREPRAPCPAPAHPGRPASCLGPPAPGWSMACWLPVSMAEAPEGHRPVRPRGRRARRRGPRRPSPDRARPTSTILGKADAADALDGGYLTTRQRHDPGRGAHGRAGRIGLVLAAAGLAARAGAALLLALPLLVCLRLRDREDDELRVGRNLRVDAARVAILLPGLQIADDQLAVDTLRRRRIREPEAVARQRRALDRLPRVVDVIGQRGQRPLAGLPPDVDRENERTATNAAPHKSDLRCHRWRINIPPLRVQSQSAVGESPLVRRPAAADPADQSTRRSAGIMPPHAPAASRRFCCTRLKSATVLSVWNCSVGGYNPPTSDPWTSAFRRKRPRRPRP